MARGLECAVHKHSTLIPQEKHHIWPLGYHGPNIKSNLVLICCNAHSDIHYYMEYLLKSGGRKPDNWRTYGPKVRFYGMLGYIKVMAYGHEISSTK